MFGAGWTEMLVVGVVALVVIGPKDLPVVMQKLGRFIGSIRRMGLDFQREISKTTGFDEIADLRRSITEPLRQTSEEIKREFNTISSASLDTTDVMKPLVPGVGNAYDDLTAAEEGSSPPAVVRKTRRAGKSAIKPSSGKTARAKKASAKSVAGKPAATKSTTTKSAAAKPVAPEPAADKAAGARARKPATRKRSGPEVKPETDAGAAVPQTPVRRARSIKPATPKGPAATTETATVQSAAPAVPQPSGHRDTSAGVERAPTRRAPRKRTAAGAAKPKIPARVTAKASEAPAIPSVGQGPAKNTPANPASSKKTSAKKA